MSLQLSGRLLLSLSACYGVLIGALAVLNVQAIGTVAVIGAMILGLLWTIRGIWGRRTTTR